MPSRPSSYVAPDVVAGIEIAMLEDACRAAPEDVRRRFGYGRRRLDGALLAYCSGIPDHPILNRLVGLTSAQPRWRQHLGEAVAEFSRRGVSGVVEAVAEDMSLLDELSESGLQPTSEGAFTLIRSCRLERPVEAALPIRDLTAEHSEQFVSLVSTVFHMPDQFVQHYALFIGRPGWTMLGAFDGPTLVATGGLYLEDGGAYLCFGATRCDYRGRGLQRALISRRMEESARRGATFMTVSVASPASGAGDPSFRNLHQAGFRVASERTSYSRPPP